MALITSDGQDMLSAAVVSTEGRPPMEAPPGGGPVELVVEAPATVGAPTWARNYVVLLAGVDLVAALIAALISWTVRSGDVSKSVMVLSLDVPYSILALAATPIWLLALAIGGAYQRTHASQGLADYRLPAVTALRLAGGASILAFTFRIGLSRLLVVVYFPVLLVTSLVLRCLCRQGLSALRRRGFALRRMLLVGDEACVIRFANHLLRSPIHGYRLVGACVPGDTTVVGRGADRLMVVGRPDDLVSVSEVNDVDTVLIVGHPHLEATTIQEVAWRIERSGRTLLVGPDVVDLAGPRISVAAIGGLPLLHIGDPLIGVHRHTVKGFYERLVAAVLLVLSTPVFAVVALAILIDSGGPVFYRQQRVGFKGRLFTIVKFRTMEPDAEAKQEALRHNNDHDGALFKMRADPRVTRVGKWLRRYSLDELPQLLNVVRGDMVLIGPRPCLPAEALRFGEAAQRRFLAKPGLTGLWQVSGRSDIPWDEAVRLDLYYVENWSPWMDLMIAWRTLKVLVTGMGGY